MFTMKNLSPTDEPIKIIRPGLYSLARVHKPGCFTQAPCESKCTGAYFFCLPCQLERSFGRPFKVTQESANSYQKLNKPLRFDSAEQRSGACGGRQTVGAKAETLPVDAIAPWVKLIQTGRGGSRQCVDKVALNFKSKAVQINFCAAFFFRSPARLALNVHLPQAKSIFCKWSA